MRPIRALNAYLDRNQARRNASVAGSLRAPEARPALRRANAGLAAAALVIVAVCVLLGLGVRRPAAYVAAAVVLVAALSVTAATIARVSGIERADPAAGPAQTGDTDS